MSTVNDYQVIDMVTRKALPVLKNALGIGNRCKRDHDAEFGRNGSKIGDTLRIRIPTRYVTTNGPAPTLQNFVQNQVPVAVQSQLNVALEFTTKDLALEFDSFTEQFIEPAAVQLASSIDLLGFGVVIANSINAENVTYNGNYSGFIGLVTPGNMLDNYSVPAAWVGAPLNAGQTAQLALQTMFNAQAILDNQSAPPKRRWGVVSPRSAAASLAAQSNFFNPQVELGEQFQNGLLGVQANAIWHTSPNVPTFTAGNWAGGTPVVAVTSVDGATTLQVSGFTNGATINVGDQFVIGVGGAGTYEVNRISRVSVGQLQVFTVIAPATNDGSGNFTLTVGPTINSPTSAQYQTVSKLPQSGDSITMMGTAGKQTDINIMYSEDALTLVTAELYNPRNDGAFGAMATDPEDGFSLRYVRQYEVLIDQLVPRLDVLVGWAVPRPELGVRLHG